MPVDMRRPRPSTTCRAPARDLPREIDRATTRPASSEPRRPAAASRRRRTRALGYWIARYGPQDLVATVALLTAAALLAGQPASVLGPACAAAELVAFYGVAFLRHRRGEAAAASRAGTRTVAVRMLREYGPPEALDVAARPLLVAAGSTLVAPTLVGVGLGAVAADLVFYLGAARLHRSADEPHRTESTYAERAA